MSRYKKLQETKLTKIRNIIKESKNELIKVQKSCPNKVNNVIFWSVQLIFNICIQLF